MSAGPTRVEVVAAAPVAAPAAATWEVLTDWERHRDWMLATRARGTAAGGRAVGGGIEAWTGLGPIAVRDTMTITAWEPPRRCEVEHTGRVVRGTGVLEVVPVEDSRSRVVWSERLEPPFGRVGRLGWVMVRPLVTAALRTSLRRLARLVEEDEVNRGTP
ncbi:MAG: SRPBCC family protein [Streptosporangiales bacterium]|nr:SRPBCC family protein [Streptosporangiales bacterium]